MSLARLVDELACEGVRLWVEGGQIRFAGPTSALTPERRQTLADHRGALLGMLSGDSSPRARYPASPEQVGLYLLEQQRTGGDNPYHEGVTLALSERLDPSRLAAVARALALRHPILRASLEWTEDGLVQSIRERVDPRVRVEAIADEDQIDEHIRRIRPTDLGDLFWVLLLRGPQRDLLHVGGHHIAVDAWSLLELCQQALLLLQGGAPLEDRQDMRYFRWLSELSPPESDPAWVAGLRSLEPRLALPRSDRFEQRHVPIEVGGAAYEQISALARSLGCTRYQLLLGCWCAVLHRFTGQEALLVASPSSSRADASLEGMVGYAVEMIPVAASFEPSSTLRALVLQVRAHLDALASEARRPLGDVAGRAEAVFAYQNLPGFRNLSRRETDHPRFSGGPTGLVARVGRIEAELVFIPARAAKFPIELHLYELSDALAGHLSLSGTLEPWLAPRLVEALERLVETLCQESLDEPLASHRAFRGPPLQLPPRSAPPLVPGLLRASWEAHAGAIAVDDSEGAHTYADLRERRDRWSSALIEIGVRGGDRVAVKLPRSLDLLAAIAAVWERGAVYVPLDLAWSDERVARCLRAAEVSFAIVEDGGLAGTRSISPRDLGSARPVPAPQRISPEDLSHVYFTSGTTGEPKAVGLIHEGLAELFDWIRSEFDPSELEAVSGTSSPAFDFSLFELLAPSVSGGRVVCRRSLHELLDESPRGLTMLCAVPGIFTAALAYAKKLPPDLRAVNFGGEALARGLVRSVRASSSATVRNLYGPSEATMLVTCETVPERCVSPSVGRAIGRNLVFVADREGEAVIPGVYGEVVAVGPSVGRGYLNGSDGSGFFAARQGRGFRTGDLGYADPQARISLAGRRDARVKIRGVRLELAAIEALAEEISPVQRAAATYDGEVLRLYVVTGAPAEDLAEQITDRLRRALSDAAVPDELFRVGELPVGTSGKIDRDRLPERVVEALQRRGVRFVAPSSALETLVALVWAEVLELERVGVEDDFFAIGGHSLAAVQILATIERVLAASMPVVEMQELGTVARFCRRLRERAADRDLEESAARVVRVLTMSEDEVEATLGKQEGTFRD